MPAVKFCNHHLTIPQEHTAILPGFYPVVPNMMIGLIGIGLLYIPSESDCDWLSFHCSITGST
ncbi:hypothetical protein K493DRAFT_75667 [Basidiobolus meristosporus CBS 931.73]|uniref:Uncharacterized protein n=1 Tax=Basidiobolus meristosporus CBS 931.73 TaxID=1314790 RepID=A0A1Y1XSM9_9FUNG|nr:hypothetical protein K493DRAFT_75667 [Basidiobolus meristosporus CBS 931.73]|eukprot:ORX88738.1 hypothetical protein K493DRAFT_75667 [Basidiobolus meristosporus CBS 931.73]